MFSVRLSVRTLAAAAVLSGFLFAQQFSRAGAARYMQSQDWQGLVRYSTAWTRAQPNNPDGWSYLGMAYGLHLHQPAQAADALRHSVQLAPNDPAAWHALGVTYIDLKQYPNAVDAIRRAIRINPAQPTYWNNLADAYSEQGDWKSSIATLDQEWPLAQRLNNVRVWYVLGNGYLKMEIPAKAVAAYQKAIALRPNLAAPWTNMGVMLAWGGNTQGALQAYDRAASLGDRMAAEHARSLRTALAEAARQQASNSHFDGGRIIGESNRKARELQLHQSGELPMEDRLH